MASEKLREAMTLAEARSRIPDRTVPDFWVGDMSRLRHLVHSVKRGAMANITVTPAFHAIWLVSYGEPEVLPRRANFNAAVGGQDPTAYADRARRERPVVAFIGPVHGHETEGLTGLANLIAVMETGRDMRGRFQPELRRLGDRCRLLIIPCGNPDGLDRFEPRMLNGMTVDDIRFWGQGTDARDVLWGWPGCKRQHPMHGEGNVGFLGCYFNGHGINPMHDEWFDPLSREVVAFLDLVREEAPDFVVSLHSHERAPALLRPAYVPLEVQAEVAALASETYARLEAQGFEHADVFEPQPEQGAIPAEFNLVSALYHTSGATTFTFECPHGTRGATAYAVDPEGILDIQLTLYTALLARALARHADSV